MTKTKNTTTPADLSATNKNQPKRGIGWFITKFIQGVISGAFLIIAFQMVTSLLDAIGANTEITSLNQISTITAVNVFIIYVVMNFAWKIAKKIFKFDLTRRVANTNISPEMKEQQTEQMNEVKRTVKDFVLSLGFGKSKGRGEF